MPASRADRLLLLAVLVLGLLWRVSDVLRDDGIYWPDEVYQSLEPAHRLVYGYGLQAWEYLDGARTWALPGFVAGVMGLLKLLGLTAATQYLTGVKLTFALLSLAAGWGTYRLARTSGAHERWALLAGAVYVLCGPVLYFSNRAMSENLSAALAVWGLALALDRAATKRALVLGGSLLGLAVLVRLQTALFAAGAVAVLAARWWPSRKAAPPAAQPWLLFAVLAGWAVVMGLLDAATWHHVPGAKWGGLFHSVVVYVRFNLIEGKAAGWGTSSWDYFLRTLWTSMPLVAAALGLGAVAGARKAPGLAVLAVAFFALHSAMPHKEYRFLLPMLPLVAALAGAGFSLLSLEVLGGRVVGAVVLAAALLSGAGRHALTFGDLGAYAERPRASAWDDFGPVNRLMLAAGKQEDLCGLRIDAAHLAWTGGSTYLHRDAPLYMPGTPPQGGHFNYVITFPGSGAQVVAKDGPLELVRIPVPCVRDTAYSWRLP